MKTTIYTAIYGDYDRVKEQPLTVKVFTEATHPRKEKHPRMKAKYFKCNPHKELDCDVSIWIDGSATILTKEFKNWCLDQLGDSDIALVKHPERNCIYAEAQYCQHMPKYEDQPIANQVQTYRQTYNYPENAGLWACGLVIRRHNRKVREFNKLWWEHNKKYSYQDQLSFPVCAKLAGISVATIDINLWDNEVIDFKSPHRTQL